VIVEVVTPEKVKLVGGAGIVYTVGVQENVLKLPFVVPAKFTIGTLAAKVLVTGAVANVNDGVALIVT
jgi:hypothetical protein